jgi:agmatinase
MSHFDPNAAASAGSGIFGLPHTERDAKVVMLPVPFDATTSYREGTHRGPEAIFEASKQVDLFDIDTGKPYEEGFFMREISKEVLAWNQEARAQAVPVIKAGGISDDAPQLQAHARACNTICEKMNAWVYAQTQALLADAKLVALIGGDHSVPFGAIRALGEAHPGMGVLHLDAHADLRVGYEGFTWSHASIMWNVMEKIPGVAKLVQVGIRDFGEQEHDYIQANKGRIKTFFDAHLKAAAHEGEPWRKVCERIVAELPQKVYLSFDIDGLDPTLCPNTGTPVPGGLSFAEVVTMLSVLAASGKHIVGLDLNEVAPSPSDHDEWDANVGARLLYKMVGFMLKTQPTGAR